MALDLLKKAEILSKNSLRLKSITCNNMACYYSRTKKVRSAVNFLEEALTIEYKQLKEVPDDDGFESALLVDNPSDALLNLCVSMSDLGRHEQALQNAMQALVFIQNEIIQRTELTKVQKEEIKKEEPKKEETKKQEAKKEEPKKQEVKKEETKKQEQKKEEAKKEEKKEETKKQEQKKEDTKKEEIKKEEPRRDEIKREGAGLMKPLKDRYAVLCIAYHNIAVQHEFLKNVIDYITNQIV